MCVVCGHATLCVRFLCCVCTRNCLCAHVLCSCVVVARIILSVCVCLHAQLCVCVCVHLCVCVCFVHRRKYVSGVRPDEVGHVCVVRYPRASL